MTFIWRVTNMSWGLLLPPYDLSGLFNSGLRYLIFQLLVFLFFVQSLSKSKLCEKLQILAYTFYIDLVFSCLSAHQVPVSIIIVSLPVTKAYVPITDKFLTMGWWVIVFPLWLVRPIQFRAIHSHLSTAFVCLTLCLGLGYDSKHNQIHCQTD